MASYERRLMLLQQREISKIRRSAQYYQEKIRAYSSRHHDLQQSLSSPCLSLDESHDTQVSIFTTCLGGNFASKSFVTLASFPGSMNENPGTRLELLLVVEAVATLYFTGARGVNS